MELMKIKGSKLLSNTWQQTLIITDTGVESTQLLHVGRRIRKSLPYERIAQVNLSNGIVVCNMEIVNTGGADNIVIRALNKKEAAKAKDLIEKSIEKANRGDSTTSDVPSQIQKLSDIRKQGIITEEEFQKAKSDLLAKL